MALMTMSASGATSGAKRATIAPSRPIRNFSKFQVTSGAGLGAIDGRFYVTGGTPPTAPSWAAVPELTASAYVSTAPGSIRYNVRAAGSATNLFADATALAGVAATVDLDAQPGTTIAGSAVSGFVFPRSVAGSTAPATFTTPGIIFVWDRRPPRAPGL